MLNLRYVGSEDFYQVNFRQNNENLITITGDFPVKRKGFKIYLPGDQTPIGDYSSFVTIYRELDNGVMFSNDGSVFVPSVRFTANGGMLDGTLVQNVHNYEDLVIPTPIEDETHKFLGWNSEIPTSGKIDDHISFTARFEYIPTVEELKAQKINMFSDICKSSIINGVDVELSDNIEHFSYSQEDQTNLKEIIDLALQTNVPMYYHSDGNGCKLYSVEELIAIYSSASTNKMHHITYFNQIRMYIDSLETREEVNAVEYGQELTGEYLQTYEQSMAQAQLVLETLLTRRAALLAGE